jgi:hypothetical protein
MQSIIKKESFFSLDPGSAVQLIQHHQHRHRVPTATVSATANPLVCVFVEEMRVLAWRNALRAFDSSPHDKTPVALEYAIHNCPQLWQMHLAIGGCLSCVPESHVLISSVENSAMRNSCTLCSVCAPD